jgi:uncharacterized membrane protein HdeD (DUF308 family)
MSPEPIVPPIESSVRQELQHLREHWVLMLILGIGLAVLGTIAIGFGIASAFITTLATVAFIGTLLLIGGVIELVNAITGRSWRGFFVHLLVGIIYAVVGLLMMNQPIGAAVGLTLMLAAAFIVGGCMRIVVAAMERFHGWGWTMVNGFISLFLGIYIWRHFPQDALWVIGVFVGIDLIFAGWSWIFLALGIRNAFPAKA